MKINYKSFLSPSFLICAAVLIVSASSKSLIDKATNIITRKEPIPLKKPLEQINENSLGNYKIVKNIRIENEDIVEELGTEDYMQCLLEDTKAPLNSSVRFCSLFITYYTGDPDTVPHVPDECYVGGGNKQETAETVGIKLDSPTDENNSSANAQSGDNFEVRRIVFSKSGANVWDTKSKFSRLYFFKVNGDYACNREETRAKMAKNIFGKYSYFSKVEWQFYGANSSPSREEMIQASGKMLSSVIPVLEQDHWPDWKAGAKNKEAEQENQNNSSDDKDE